MDNGLECSKPFVGHKHVEVLEIKINHNRIELLLDHMHMPLQKQNVSLTKTLLLHAVCRLFGIGIPESMISFTGEVL